jgi:DNA-binding MarR family transcriptional regulator
MNTEIICIVYDSDVIDMVLLVSSDTAPTRNIGLLLHDVARLFRRRFDEVARNRQLGFTRAQASVLIHLSRNQGINQVSLAQLMELEPITLVRLLDRLQAAGLVERRADPTDRRARNLFLTDAAPAMLARIEILATEIREDAMAGLDGEDAERLIFILHAMKLNLLEQSGAESGKTAPGPQNIQVANA